MKLSKLPDNEQLIEASEHIKGIFGEANDQSRLVLIEAYHQIGQIILSLPSRYLAVSDLSRLTEMSERTLYRAAQFYEKYPDWENQLPEGKAISWNKIVTKYLPIEQPKDCEHEFRAVFICVKCGRRQDDTPKIRN